MDTPQAATIFECLSSATRLEIYRLLVKHGERGLVAGEIASALQIANTNLSFHLKALTHAGLLHVTQQGRFQRYRADLASMQQLIHYLTDECCAGHPERCFNINHTGNSQ